jgi:thiosulfate reductase cytochrome b subunit
MAAFMMMAFVIVHVYLITTGHTIGAHLKAMITGWEEVDD